MAQVDRQRPVGREERADDAKDGEQEHGSRAGKGEAVTEEAVEGRASEPDRGAGEAGRAHDSRIRGSART